MARLTKNLFTTPVPQRSQSLVRFSQHSLSSSCALSINNQSMTLGKQTTNSTFVQKRHKFSFDDDSSNDWDFSSNKSSGSRNSGNFDFDFNPVNESRMRQNDFGFGGRGMMQAKSRFAKQEIKWSEEELTPFRKDFYKEHPSVTAMTEDELQKMREELNMIVFGTNIPKPFKTFQESAIPDQCLQHLDKMGITKPSAIQQQGIPMALSGRDIVGISRTGSGKTLAYLLPAIVHIQAQAVVQRGEGPIGLVLAPTRELTLQISKEIENYAQNNQHIQLKHCAVFGGSDRHKQISCLRQSPDLLVATPGRLLDLLECGETNFKRCTYLVLDEADRMLDMGFRDDLETILSYVRPDRQTLMWSATWPKEIQSIANNYTNDAIRVQIGSTDLHANQDINQTFKFLNNPRQKTSAFMEDMQEIGESGKKCLVFANTKRGADMLEQRLAENNIRARAIHGDKSQSARENIMHHFRANRFQVLIATDVVARGIDIRDIEIVMIYDMPSNLEDYVHRIGRTARAGDKGTSLSYLTQDDLSRLGTKLVRLLKKSNQEVPAWLEANSF